MTTESSNSTAQIKLHRSREYFAKFRAYRVFIDGQKVTELRDGQTVTLDVTPGLHKLEIRIDWTRSNAIEFDVSEGTLDFECGSAMQTFPKLLLSILYITIWYDRCLYLRPKAPSEVPMAA